MKEALALIYAALIAPLVEAIKENTAAISASKSSCTSAPSPTTGTEAPEPQPEPAKRGRKSAAADKAPPADEPAGEAVGVDDLIAHAKSLDDTSKEKFKGWLTKNFGVQSLAELKESDRPNVLKFLKDKGATDTRVSAAPEEDW